VPIHDAARASAPSGGSGVGSVESLREAVEVGAGELPLEWGGDLLAAAAEGEELLLEGVKIWKSLGVRILRWTMEK
jgi:hypothetical protein